VRLLRALALLVIWLAASAPALAHPHLFIDAKAVLLFDAEGRFTGMRHEWTFDEAFSSWSIQGLDANNDGVTSREEMQGLADEHMRGLADYSFYTFAGEGPTNLVFAYGHKPTLDYENSRTTLRFEVVLDQPYAIADALEVAVNDPEYYVAITFAGPTTVSAEGLPDRCSLSLEPPRPLTPELEARIFAIPPDQQLPSDLVAAVRGTQGGILVRCEGAPETAVEAAEAVAEAQATAPSNPFGGPPPEPGFTMPRTGFLGWVAQQQQSFYAALTGALGRLKTDNTAFWVLGGLSFLYGIFHAAGPGHGKVVVSSYVLANERQLRQGVLLSFVSAMLQSVVAVVFIGVTAAGLAMTSAAMGDAANWIGIASYVLVALLGLWLIARKLFKLGGHDHRHDHKRARAHLYGEDEHAHPGLLNHDHDHDRDDAHDEAPGHRHVVTASDARGDWREQLAVVLAVGLRPCSGALVVLVFALSQGLLAAGIAAVFLMGLGTAITVATLASLAVGAKSLAGRLTLIDSGLGASVIWWLELAAAFAVFAFGVILVLASL
jgi:nickel/cobalt exporter